MFIFGIHIPQTQFSHTEGIFITLICVMIGAMALYVELFFCLHGTISVYTIESILSVYIFICLYTCMLKRYAHSRNDMRHSQEECI